MDYQKTQRQMNAIRYVRKRGTLIAEKDEPALACFVDEIRPDVMEPREHVRMFSNKMEVTSLQGTGSKDKSKPPVEPKPKRKDRAG